MHVQVLHNDHMFTPAMELLKHALGTDRGKKSWDYTCKLGCRSVQGVLHGKKSSSSSAPAAPATS